MCDVWYNASVTNVARLAVLSIAQVFVRSAIALSDVWRLASFLYDTTCVTLLRFPDTRLRIL